MIIIYILVALAVLVIGFKLAIGANMARLNNLRRPDGSYADYDFPGILNGGKSVEFAEPDLKGPGPHQSKDASKVDLYGRPLPPEVAEKRSAETNSRKQTVFVLQHTVDDDSEPKLLGIYESHDSAKAAIERFRQLDEFAEYSDGFRFTEYELGKDYGDTGFNSN
ncbi:hypothetical protein [Bremerella sp.]|uniref:DUF7336 domain-containing protein n=1 Tax=Bremerella sp. TaxID=2795602 RepID=UPI003919A0D3